MREKVRHRQAGWGRPACAWPAPAMAQSPAPEWWLCGAAAHRMNFAGPGRSHDVGRNLLPGRPGAPATDLHILPSGSCRPPFGHRTGRAGRARGARPGRIRPRGLDLVERAFKAGKRGCRFCAKPARRQSARCSNWNPGEAGKFCQPTSGQGRNTRFQFFDHLLNHDDRMNRHYSAYLSSWMGIFLPNDFVFRVC